jgi:Pyruvate/2-oxoacid:ferredoxin oxidoreductase gamma subunit
VITLLKNEQGMALAVLTMLIAILASMTGAALLFSRIDLMISGNYKTGTGSLYAADAGVGVALKQIKGGDWNASQAAIGPTAIGDYTFRSYLPGEGTDTTAKPIAAICDQSGYGRSSGRSYNSAGSVNLGVRNYDIFILGTGPLNSAKRKIEAKSQYGPSPCQIGG